MLASEFSANSKTSAVNPTSTERITASRPRSLMVGIKLLTIFSLKATDGASSVADEQLMIADSKAPKKIICAAIGVCCTIRVGRMSWESRSSKPATCAGSISVAE